jgi:hypothetical protein
MRNALLTHSQHIYKHSTNSIEHFQRCRLIVRHGSNKDAQPDLTDDDIDIKMFKLLEEG